MTRPPVTRLYASLPAERRVARLEGRADVPGARGVAEWRREHGTTGPRGELR